MTKPLTIEIDETAAEQLARIANDLGETPEQFAARAVAASIESFEASALFARRAKGGDKTEALAWLRQMAKRDSETVPDADDRLPAGHTR